MQWWKYASKAGLKQEGWVRERYWDIPRNSIASVSLCLLVRLTTWLSPQTLLETPSGHRSQAWILLHPVIISRYSLLTVKRVSTTKHFQHLNMINSITYGSIYCLIVILWTTCCLRIRLKKHIPSNTIKQIRKLRINCENMLQLNAPGALWPLSRPPDVQIENPTASMEL